MVHSTDCCLRWFPTNAMHLSGLCEDGIARHRPDRSPCWQLSIPNGTGHHPRLLYPDCKGKRRHKQNPRDSARFNLLWTLTLVNHTGVQDPGTSSLRSRCRTRTRLRESAQELKSVLVSVYRLVSEWVWEYPLERALGWASVSA